MTKISFFFRNPKVGISIGKVFNTITKYFPNSNNVIVPSPRSLPGSLLHNLLYIFRHRNKYGINHITGDIHYAVYALMGCKTVLTIHDMVLMENKKGLSRYIKGLIWYKWPVKFATYTTFISKHTKEEFEKYYGSELRNSKVIYNPVDDIYKVSKKPFNQERPVVLHVGTRENKNLTRVIEALNGIPCELRIIGKSTKDYLSCLKRNNIDFVFRENISEEELEKEYSNSDVISFPSTYEGFGMPIIEGQSEGKVVVTSDLAPMNEIANGSAILVDPYSVNSIRDGFITAIFDEDTRNRKIQLGLDNVKRFNSKTIASQYRELYNCI